MSVELHIVVKEAGDPEALAKLVNAAVEMTKTEPTTVTRVPNGYRCIECYSDDGNHTGLCAFGMNEPKKQGAVL